MKKIIAAFAVAAVLAAGTGGAQAAFNSLAHCNALRGDSSKWSTARLEYRLQQAGIRYKEISTFVDCFMVIQVHGDGSKEMLLFDPATLNRVYIHP